ILQQRETGCLRQSGADQEVAIAGQEEDGKPLRGGLQHLRALLLEARDLRRVVADPGFEQVAQDEQRIRPHGSHVAPPGREGAGFSGLQVQVGDAFDAAPAGGGAQFLRRWRGGRRGPGVQTTTAFSTTRSVFGTSPWPLRVPVGTPLRRSMMSLPPTTLPNTA